MAASSLSAHFQALLAAIAAGDDAQTDRLARQCTAADEYDLLALAASAQAEERWWAVRALAEMGSQAAAGVLADRLADPEALVRAGALLALGQLQSRDAAAVEPYLNAMADRLGDEDGSVRRAAGDGLALCGDAAVPALARVVFQGANDGARARAAGALRRIGTIQAAAVLYALLNDPNPLARTHALEGLDEMGLLENLLLLP